MSAHRGEILHLIANPTTDGEQSVEYFEDGILLLQDGHITALGPAEAVLCDLPESVSVNVHNDALIIPGLVDTHVHYPQTNIIASHGKQLLDWLNTYTFPEERKFENYEYADEIAAFFLDELIRNGTTSAAVFGTVHPESIDAFFKQAEARNMRMIAGKVMMDRNAPDYLRDTAESSYDDTLTLIEKWHNKNRLSYAVTPRFAPTSTDAQLRAAERLLKEFPDVYMQTHVAENTDECAWVQSLFPDQKSYLDVYDHYGLLGKRSILAHGIYLEKADWKRLCETDSAISFCPLSNLFIGSGLFEYQKALDNNVKVGLGTDVGGGDSFSLFRTINEAYKVQQLNKHDLDPFVALYLATLGGATAIDQQHNIGNFLPGKEADFIVLGCNATPLLSRRIKATKSLHEKLFALLMIGDDRLVRETWVMGREMKSKIQDEIKSTL